MTASKSATLLQHVTPIHSNTGALACNTILTACTLCPATGTETYQSLLRTLRKRLVRLPTIDPAPDQVYPSKDFSAVLKKAQQDQKKRGDTYLGVDVLLLALLNDSEITAAIAETGLTKGSIENALQEVRPAVSVPLQGCKEWVL